MALRRASTPGPRSVAETSEPLLPSATSATSVAVALSVTFVSTLSCSKLTSGTSPTVRGGVGVWVCGLQGGDGGVVTALRLSLRSSKDTTKRASIIGGSLGDSLSDILGDEVGPGGGDDIMDNNSNSGVVSPSLSDLESLAYDPDAMGGGIDTDPVDVSSLAELRERLKSLGASFNAPDDLLQYIVQVCPFT